MANDESLKPKIGRVTRSQYWILMFLFLLPLLILVDHAEGIGWLSIKILLSIPIIHAYIGRWHDLGYSGWMTLLSFIPIIGLLTSIYISLVKGEERDNKYGPNPYIEKYSELAE